ncbi:hypothetical protein SEA_VALENTINIPUFF_58 [Microbacterium phage ValentiniPuff]|uniref:Uncharacterized protein n=1 Tax=Microbacterium phage ValentiniPuff TaxID=2315705 RepID=A0A386KP35_9CAUD|nr:hypothetical protein SEA_VALENTINIPUFF_58 [Microbacterium phage ValentiniPuff]
MTFTYNSPPATPRDEVRFWSTDTVERAYSVSDEDIEYLLSPEQLDGNVMAAAAAVAERIANYWSATSEVTGASVKIGPFAVNDGRSSLEMAQAWRDLAARLRSGTADGSLSLAGGLFTGQGVPEFSLGMQDNGVQWFNRRGRDVRPQNGVW